MTHIGLQDGQKKDTITRFPKKYDQAGWVLHSHKFICKTNQVVFNNIFFFKCCKYVMYYSVQRNFHHDMNMTNTKNRIILAHSHNQHA